MDIANLLTSNDFKKTSNPHQLRYKCIWCGEQKYKLTINLSKKVFICHKCGQSGRLDNLIPTNTDQFQDKVKEFKNGTIRRSIGDCTFPKEIITPVRESSGVPFNYLINRGITKEEIRSYKIGYCSEGRYQERVILPIFEYGKLVYYSGRTYTSRSPKYLNCGSGRNKIIFKTFSGTSKSSILVEGAFDAIQVAKVFPAIAILGKVISEIQCRKIAEATQEVYVMLDKDAKKETFQVAKQLGYYIPAKAIFIGQKDPGSMTEQQIRKAIKCASTKI